MLVKYFHKKWLRHFLQFWFLQRKVRNYFLVFILPNLPKCINTIGWNKTNNKNGFCAEFLLKLQIYIIFLIFRIRQPSWLHSRLQRLPFFLPVCTWWLTLAWPYFISLFYVWRVIDIGRKIAGLKFRSSIIRTVPSYNHEVADVFRCTNRKGKLVYE